MTVYVVNSDYGLQGVYSCKEAAIAAAAKEIRADSCYFEISEYNNIEEDLRIGIGGGYPPYTYWVESFELKTSDIGN